MPASDSSTKKPSVLLVDDDQDFTRTVRLLLRDAFAVRAVHEGAAALAEFRARVYDAVLLDLDLAQAPDGLEVLRQIRERDLHVPVFMVTRTERPEVALEAGRMGATDYFTKGCPIEMLAHRIRTALTIQMEHRRREALERSVAGKRWRFVGDSDAVRKLRADAETVAQVNSPVLITGKSGTGKEVLARFIHQQSPRARKPFVAVNCAAIPEGLVESELFGRERGAYTGATTARRGSFELAEGGTLFLDEIAEMPPALQPKLLRVLQSGEYSQIGSERLRSADARVLCSTNVDPHEAISSGRLREDLFYRINVVTLHIPPLSERREDVLVLAKHFLELKCQELGRNVEGFTPAAESLLLAHHWPGNAREMENLIERAMVFCQSCLIEADLLGPICEGAPFLDLPWEQARERALMRFERSYLAALLHVHHGVASHASEAMGVTRQAFYRALKRAGLKAEDFR